MAVGVLLFINPVGFTTAVTIGFGVLLLAVAAFAFVRYFSDRRAMGQGSVLTLFLAILTLLIGCVCTFASGWVLGLFAIAAMVYGVILTVAGIFKLATYVERRQSGLHPTVLSLIGALVSIVLGLFILLNPFDATEILWQIAGVALIVEAVFDLIGLVDGLAKRTR
ncbi:MAG: DUF308 domain-containing protein [Clostridia bacterium]|nr:DUF308 domain-containing protein [Clostridia bacterium]